MNEIIFTLIALAATVLAVAGAVKACKRVKQRWGAPAAALLAIVFIALASLGGKQHNWKTIRFKTPDHLRYDIDDCITTPLKEMPLSQYKLNLTYGLDTLSGRYIPLTALASQTGIHYGHNWKPLTIQVHTAPDNRHFLYHILAAKEWCLLGIPVYSQTEVLDGAASIPPVCSRNDI